MITNLANCAASKTFQGAYSGISWKKECSGYFFGSKIWTELTFFKSIICTVMFLGSGISALLFSGSRKERKSRKRVLETKFRIK